MANSLNLTAYNAVQQATFVRLVLIDGGIEQIVRMSTHNVPISITELDGNSYSYTAIGSLLNVSSITADEKTTFGDVNVTIAAIPNQYMSQIINNPIKGSPVEIRRAFFDVATNELLPVAGNPTIEFIGVVNSYSTDEGWSDQDSLTATTQLSLSCSSIMTVLSKKIAGRRTNHDDQVSWFPGDLAFDRVPVIADSTFDFGGTSPNAATNRPSGITVTNTTV